MKEMRRVLALLLCLVMLIGVMPVSAFATDEAGNTAYEDLVETPDDGSIEGSNETPDDGSDEGSNETPDDGSDEGSNETPDDGSDEGSNETPDDGSDEGSNETPDDGSDEDSTETPDAGDDDDSGEEPEVIAVTGITLDQTSVEVGVGEVESMILTATVLPENATDKTVTWHSSEEGVAAVDENGLLTFGYMGEAVITATAGEFSAICTVKVGEGDWGTYDTDATIVIAGSDYQNNNNGNGGLFSSGAATDTYAIMSQIKEDYASAYGFLFGGDYYAHNVNTTTESTNGKNQLKNEIVDVIYPDMADETQIYIQGNHDADSLTTNGTLATSGAHDTDYYGVYVINEKDYMWYNDNQSTIKSTASALESYLDAKLTDGYNKPIFVLSHLPLHYSNRTIKEGDGKYAKYIYDVLDEAGKNDLNIIFMYGHNHSTSYYEEYLGNAAVYLAEGDTIYVANEGSQSSCFSDTLNFTYMNYGFTGYLNGTAADGALTMTVFEIYEDEVQVKRYDASGVHNLKSAGTNGSTPSGATYNTTVYTSPQTIKLTTPAAKATFTSNGVTVTAVGITAVTATKEANPTYNASLYSGYEVYNVSAEGYEAGKNATVTIALTDGDFDTARAVTVKFPDGHTEDIAVVNGTVTVETDALGTFTLTQKVQTTIEIPGDSGSSGNTGSTNIWRQVTSMTAGKKYLLVNYGYNASGLATYAIGTNGHTAGATVSVLTDSEGKYIETTDTGIQWTAVASSRNGYVNLQNVSSNSYLTASNSTSEADLAVSNSVSGYAYWNTGLIAVSGTEPTIAAYQSSGDGYRFVRYSAGEGGFVTYPNGNTEKNDNWIALFEQETSSSSGGSSVETFGGNWVTITEPTGGTTTYTYTQATSITAGQKYVIVGNDHDIALQGTTSMGTQSVTISGNTMTSTTALTEWTFSGSNSGTIYNGTRYLQYSDRAFSLSTSSTNFTITDNGSNFRIQSGNYSFYYNGSSWTRSGRSTAQYVRLYQLTDTTTTGGNPGLYGKLDGDLTYTVPYGTSEAVALQKVKDGIAIKYATASDYSDEATFADDGEGMTWEVVNYDSETPGEYAVNISYNGTLLGTAKIIVNAKPAGNATLVIDSDSGSVREGAGSGAYTGSKLIITYEDGTQKTVNVTVGMLRDEDGNEVSTASAGTYSNLTVVYSYAGIEYEVCVNGYTLTVRENVQNNYPEYPDEGAVKVNKTGTGIDFQSSGIARVELSASGVPSKKGVDVIVMVDTSSSMTYCIDHVVKNCATCGASKYRIAYLKAALASMMEQFTATGDDGEQLDIKVAIADFNGYSAISSNAKLDGINANGTTGESNTVFTGDLSNPADAFVQAYDIDTNAVINALTTASGTNYDDAMETVYRLGTAINAENTRNNEDRDLFVIFMSDGAPYQYNYINGGTYTNWNYYLLGTLAEQNLTGILPDAYAHFYNANGDHWLAEAVKGETNTWHDVIDGGKLAADSNVTTQESDMGNYFVQIKGLGAEMHVIGFCLTDDTVDDRTVYATTQRTVLTNMASVDSYGNALYHESTTGTDLADIFCDIASQIAYAATNARFVDQMGDNYNLQLETSTYTIVENGVEKEKTLVPVIEIGTYPIYTRQDYIDGKCTEAQIGNRTGSFNLTEVVKFSDDGKQAYSNLVDVDKDGTFGVTVNADGTYTISDTDDNIFGTDGVIYAKNFMYNTGATAVTVNGITVDSEQFYWKMGTIQTSELAMRYYVYLDGSMEGTREGGSYPTNEYATLYYDNYLGNACKKDTVSPVMPWKEANVSYAFYLVDENGDIIVNQTTGATGTFANKIAVTNPVVYETILLNNLDEVSSIDVASLGVLPEGYTLYDSSAVYTVYINSNTTGAWEIDRGTGKVNSTYVMQYDPNNETAYSNTLAENTIGHDYTHTTVWFAVLWKVQALPDTVVIDYGLPVDISVLTNDMFGEAGKLAGVGAYSDTLNLDGHDTTLASGFAKTYSSDADKNSETKDTLSYGDVEANYDTGKVRYTPNTMQMNGYDKFAYAVNYTGATNPGYYYDTVTVIPATTIYYEDSFLTFAGNNANGATTGVIASIPESGMVSGQWYVEGTTADKTQDEDRPGKYSLTDANNIYGFDHVNEGMSTHSLGSAAKVHVDADSYATATFTFAGTGFDVISMTSNKTGVIAVQVTDKNNEVVEAKIVNTYYGYSYEDGNWIAKPDTDNALYQIPVLQVENLEYGTYDVTITATYMDAFDKTSADGYDLHLDAIRIYDPANDGAADGTTDTTIEDAYKADGEGWPSYIELRNKIIEKNTFTDNTATTTQVEGLVFIDGDESVGDAQMEDYISYGPNNEVYLAPGQRVAFMLSTPTNIANVHIGIKSANGETGTYTITNIAKASNTETGVDAGDWYGAKTATMNTTTDMYYDITGYKNDIIVISNTGNLYNTTGIISLTNIKSTYTSDPNGTATASTWSLRAATADPVETYIYMTPAAATLTLRSLNNEIEEEPEETLPEETEPETTVPETTVPEEIEPETTVPEETEPETTVPEETKPQGGSNQTQQIIQQVVKTVTKILQNLFGGWFR